MGRICPKCDKTYSSRQSLCNHRKNCNGGRGENISMTQANPFLTGRQDEKQSVRHDQKHSMTKPPNPKISALVDAIIDNEAEPRKELPDFEEKEENSDDESDHHHRMMMMSSICSH